jgi:hypothetical protein
MKQFSLSIIIRFKILKINRVEIELKLTYMILNLEINSKCKVDDEEEHNFDIKIGLS